MSQSRKKWVERRRDHKALMLIGLYGTLIIVYGAFSALSFYQELFNVFYVKLSVVFFALLSLLFYLKSPHTVRYVALFVLIIEVDMALSIVSHYSSTYSTPYPFIIVFTFFFFFKFKTAMIATVFHYAFWMLLTLYKEYLYPQDPLVLTAFPINMYVTSFLVVTLSPLYYLFTEISYQQLEYSNKQNEILLKEIHHRIKNNLNVIASILGLQIMHLKRESKADQKDILLKSKLRIEAIAMVHEALYRNEDLEKIDFKTYVEDLCDAIRRTYDKKINVEIEADAISLSLETMLRLGTIINELVNNSIKHSIEKSGATNNKITIRLVQDRDNCILTYHEKNDHTVDIQKLESSKTLGIKLIKLTVQQMDAMLEIFEKDGLVFSIIFSCK